MFQFHRPIFSTIACTYPLHPCNSYIGQAELRKQHGIPDETPITLIPRFLPYEPGAWWWCSRCTKRDRTRRVNMRKQRTGGVPGTRRIMLGGRFVTLAAQTRFARRHAPPGLAWCPWGLHYTPVAELAHARKYRAAGYCEACYRLHYKDRRRKQYQAWRRDEEAKRREFTQLAQQCAALKRETAALRQLQAALVQEIIAMRVTATPPRDEVIELDSLSGPTRVPQRRATRQQYSV